MLVAFGVFLASFVMGQNFPLDLQRVEINCEWPFSTGEKPLYLFLCLLLATAAARSRYVSFAAIWDVATWWLSHSWKFLSNNFELLQTYWYWINSTSNVWVSKNGEQTAALLLFLYFCGFFEKVRSYLSKPLTFPQWAGFTSWGLKCSVVIKTWCFHRVWVAVLTKVTKRVLQTFYTNPQLLCQVIGSQANPVSLGVPAKWGAAVGCSRWDVGSKGGGQAKSINLQCLCRQDGLQPLSVKSTVLCSASQRFVFLTQWWHDQ